MSSNRIFEFLKNWELIIPNLIYPFSFFLSMEFEEIEKLILALWPLFFILTLLFSFIRKRNFIFLQRLKMMMSGKIPPVRKNDYNGEFSKIGIIEYGKNDYISIISGIVESSSFYRIPLTENINNLEIPDDLNSLVVVWSIELERHSDFEEVIKTSIEKWAVRNSETGCLIIKNGRNLNLNHFKNFKQITPDQIERLNQYLLKRSNQRAEIWRDQALFNRSFLFILFLFLAIFIIFNIFDFVNDKKEKSELIEKIWDKNDELKKAYSIIIKAKISLWKDSLVRKYKLNESEFHLTLYYSFKDSAFANKFVTTDDQSRSNGWPIDSSSVCGCAFKNLNYTIYYNNYDESTNENIFKIGRGDTFTDKDLTNCSYSNNSKSGSNPKILIYHTKEIENTAIIGLGFSSKVAQKAVKNIEFIKDLENIALYLSSLSELKNLFKEVVEQP